MSIAAAFDLKETNQNLIGLPAEERIRTIVEQFGDDVVLLSSMQKTACVLMHMFFRLGLQNDVIFGDTGFHFHETLMLRDEYMRRYRLNVVTVYPEQTPEQQEAQHGRKLHLHKDGQKECCRLRKELPFLNHMKKHGRRVVVNGLRNKEGGKRADLEVMTRDPRIGGFSLHALIDWSSEQINGYIAEHQIPIHPLHAQSYPSIGCACCTTPVQPGEDPRAGRWRHLRDAEEGGPQYCGMNYTDGSGI